MTNIRTYLLISLLAVLGACGGGGDSAVECAVTCGTNATCDTTGDEGICECNTGFTGDGLTCTADIVECADTCSTDATCNTTGAVGVCECNAGFMGDGITCAPNDVCAGVSDCAATNISCTGDDLVTCAADANGCLVETTVDCTATNEVCDGNLAIPLCVPDCTNDLACDLLAAGDTFCDGNIITACETAVDGCLAAVPGVDCALDICDESGVAAVCVANASGDSCIEPFLVLGDIALTGADITADFTNVEDFAGTNCIASQPNAVEAVFTVPLLAGQSVSISEFGGVDIVLGILPTCDGAAECFAAVDANSGPVEEAGISYSATVDETVTVYASAFFDAPGTTDYDIRLNISECGDGVTEGPETCDDANAVDGDGCTACVVDFGSTCDNTVVSVCSGPLDLGTFAAAQAIPDTVSTEILAADGSFFYSITFSEDVVIAGTLDAPGGEDIDIFFFDSATPPTELFSGETVGGEVFADQVLVAGTYIIEVEGFDAIPAGWTLVMSTIAGPVCGDGVLGIGEACDDNLVDNDGCTACVVDPGFVCDISVDPSVCEVACGNGDIDANEECDDANAVDADGCTACIVDAGFSCDNTNNPSVCGLSCGDGIVDLSEECDDGNLVDDDRCADACTLNADVVDLDGNDTFATAQPIVDGQVARGSLDPNGDVLLDVFDLYSFTLAADSWVTIEQYTTVDGDLANYAGPGLDDTLDCDSDLQVRIYDGTGDPAINADSVLFDDDDGDGLCGYLGQPEDGENVLLLAGTYFIKVSDFQDDTAVPLYGLDVQIDAVLVAGEACNAALDFCDPATLFCDAVAGNTCGVAPTIDRGSFEQFIGDFDLSNTSLTFTPNGSDFTIVGASTAAFADTAGTGLVASAVLPLGDDDNEVVTTQFGFPFLGNNRTEFFVGSNGYITFGAGDTDFSESSADHFDLQRISFLFADLTPQNGGTITADEFADRLVVTFAAVPGAGNNNEANLQVQLFDTGVIVITYLTVTEPDSLVGISAGDNLGVPPAPSDYSSFVL